LAASEHGHLDTVKYLITRGARINSERSDGKRALAIAVENKHPEVAEALKKAGAK
jgi:ankyrin repeat protein